MFPIPAFVVLAMVGMALNKTRNESKRHSGSKAREEAAQAAVVANRELQWHLQDSEASIRACEQRADGPNRQQLQEKSLQRLQQEQQKMPQRPKGWKDSSSTSNTDKAASAAAPGPQLVVVAASSSDAGSSSSASATPKAPTASSSSTSTASQPKPWKRCLPASYLSPLHNQGGTHSASFILASVLSVGPISHPLLLSAEEAGLDSNAADSNTTQDITGPTTTPAAPTTFLEALLFSLCFVYILLVQLAARDASTWVAAKADSISTAFSAFSTSPVGAGAFAVVLSCIKFATRVMTAASCAFTWAVSAAGSIKTTIVTFASSPLAARSAKAFAALLSCVRISSRFVAAALLMLWRALVFAARLAALCCGSACAALSARLSASAATPGTNTSVPASPANVSATPAAALELEGDALILATAAGSSSSANTSRANSRGASTAGGAPSTGVNAPRGSAPGDADVATRAATAPAAAKCVAAADDAFGSMSLEEVLHAVQPPRPAARYGSCNCPVGGVHICPAAPNAAL